MTEFISAIVIKSTFIVALGLGVAFSLRSASAAIRHAVLLVALTSTLVLPVLLAVWPGWSVRVLPVKARRETEQLVVARDGSSATDAGNSASTIPPRDIRGVTVPESGGSSASSSRGGSLDRIPLVAFWLFGTVLVLSWLGIGHLRLRRVARRAWPLSGGDWQELLRQESELTSVRKHVQLLSSPAINTPLTWGSVNPVILLPEDALDWPEEHRRVVLRHELAHVVRGDAFAQLLAGVVCAAYWFNPIMWIAERRLRSECERACDDRVVVSGTRPADYASHLLEVARSARSFGGPGFLAVAMARPTQLEGRLLAVLDGSRSRNAVSPENRRIIVLASAAIVLALSAFRPISRDATPIPANKIASATSDDSTFESSVAAKSGGTLVLDLNRTGGGVTITGWDQPTVYVKGRLAGRNWRETRVTLEPANGGAVLRSVYIGSASNTSFSHSFNIHVPRNFNVRVKSAGGGIIITGVTGSFTGTTGGGEINFRDLHGEASLHTGGGNISVTGSNLRGSVTTGGGEVTITGGSGELMTGEGDERKTRASAKSGKRIVTSSGTTTYLIDDDPKVVAHFGEDGIQMHRSGGDITLRDAPNGARVTTAGGAIRIGPSSGEVYASTGGGGIWIGPALGSVIASTGAGNIEVQFRGTGTHSADLTSGLGQVTLILPEGFSGTLVLEAAYTNNLGHKTRIESDWPLSVTETDQWDASIGTPRKYVRARQVFGSGSGVIRVRTVNGNVVVQKAGSAR